MQRPPASRLSRSASGETSRAQVRTVQPWSRSSSTMARPRPLEPPVTTAVRSAKLHKLRSPAAAMASAMENIDVRRIDFSGCRRIDFIYTKRRATRRPLRWGAGALLGAPRSLPLRAPHPTSIPPRSLAVARRRTNGALCLVRERHPELHRTLFGAMVLAQCFAGCHPSPWSLHNDSQACPHAPQGSGHASCYPEARVKPARP
mmetsp:Transcript_16335/g.47076  ORF Transcript_16335/g.47076 Transcript_16335/m.47076 type:complete len:203 (-) Transcript_16335:584-1192(-)